MNIIIITLQKQNKDLFFEIEESIFFVTYVLNKLAAAWTHNADIQVRKRTRNDIVCKDE